MANEPTNKTCYALAFVRPSPLGGRTREQANKRTNLSQGSTSESQGPTNEHCPAGSHNRDLALGTMIGAAAAQAQQIQAPVCYAHNGNPYYARAWRGRWGRALRGNKLLSLPSFSLWPSQCRSNGTCLLRLCQSLFRPSKAKTWVRVP
jgi:hypothetical protein